MQGKEKSFSLGTSAKLMYGVCRILRMQCKELRRATQNVLGINFVSVQQDIDLPAVPTSPHIIR